MISGHPCRRRFPLPRLFALAAFAAARLMIVAPGLVADRLELDNGDVVSGTIVGLSDGTVTILTDYGTLEIPRERIARGVVEPKRWHAVAVSFSAGEAAIYVDGAEVAHRTFAFTELARDDSPFLFMTARADTDDPYGYYNAVGSLDELRLYGRALTAEEVTLLSAPDADG